MENYSVYPEMLKLTKYETWGTLPDLFTFDDGTRMTSPEQWEARRAEIYKQAVELQYGTMPPAPEVLEYEELYIGGKGHLNTYKITAGTKVKQVSFIAKLFLPDWGTPNLSALPPVIVDGDLSFGYAFDKEYLHAALDEGVAWMLFDRTELAPDIQFRGRGIGALHEVYPDYTFGALGAWAWGYSRCVDVLEKLGLTNPDMVVFSGHSRGGKTAALAGVLDTRAAIVNPNETCAGACSCYRIYLEGEYLGNDDPNRALMLKRSERLCDLWANFDFWMGPDLGQYADRPEDLPFDAHSLKAMVAPRVLFVSEAAGDLWGNPIGSWQTTLAASEVFKYLGVPENLYWYFRPGTHAHKPLDVQMLVNIIKQKTIGAPADEKFFHTSFVEPELIFDWRAPES
ncbi:MAG: hypothetical protein IKZ16_08865 [Clostridia bacterium]|nr:hypothetical protein [Clostridia bacterium]